MQIQIARKQRGKLKVTGQTASFTPAGRTAGDDGLLGLGLIEELLLINTGQYSGSTNITVNAKVSAHSNNVVFDRVTGLMWTAGGNAAVFGTGAQHLLWEDTVSAEDIFNYCDQANLLTFAGHNDWRVPNLKEVLSVIQYNTADAGFNTAFFLSDDTCWTSTTRVTTTEAYGTGADPRVLGYAKTTTRTNRLRLVRSN